MNEDIFFGEYSNFAEQRSQQHQPSNHEGGTNNDDEMMDTQALASSSSPPHIGDVVTQDGADEDPFALDNDDPFAPGDDDPFAVEHVGEDIAEPTSRDTPAAENMDTMEGLEQMEDPDMKLLNMETDGQFIHQVAVPRIAHCEYNGLQNVDSVPHPNVLFPYRLDPAQQKALRCIDNDHSVLFSAYPGSGKGVLARYLIASRVGGPKRIIYCSPFEKLCLRAYRELCDDLDDEEKIGIVTNGDVIQLKPAADCVVMPLGVLLSLLHHKSSTLDNVGWVIFDEAHLLGADSSVRDDCCRPVNALYEECLMLLPGDGSKKCVLLADPLQNASWMAMWVAKLLKEQCHCITVDMQPLPRQHYVFPVGEKAFSLAVNSKNQFKADSFNSAMEKALQYAAAKAASAAGRKERRSNGAAGPVAKPPTTSFPDYLPKLLRAISENFGFPCMVFCAGWRECEHAAAAISHMDFEGANLRKKQIASIFSELLFTLPNEVKRSPLVTGYLRVLSTGVGIHHPGMLPFLNEITEMLYEKGYIRVLLTVESHAAEVKLAARVVLITTSKKFGTDGLYRNLTTDEYLHMAGRAGRRGKDEFGTVVLIPDLKMTAAEAEILMTGQPSEVVSHFQPSYGYVLSVLRSPDVDVNVLLQRTFHTYFTSLKMPHLRREKLRLQSQLKGFHVNNAEHLANVHRWRAEMLSIKEKLREKIYAPNYLGPFLQQGRLLHMSAGPIGGSGDFGWGVLCYFHKRPDVENILSQKMIYTLDVAVLVDSECAGGGDLMEGGSEALGRLRPPRPGDPGVIAVVSFKSGCVCGVSAIRLKMPDNLDDPRGREALREALKNTVEKRMNNHVTELNPIAGIGLGNGQAGREVKSDWEHYDRLRQDYYTALLEPASEQDYAAYKEKLAIAEKSKRMVAEVAAHDDRNESTLKTEFDRRLQVLRGLGYVDDEGKLQPKAQVPITLCSATNEPLVLSELLANGHFDHIRPFCAAALLSCFVLPPGTSAHLGRLHAVDLGRIYTDSIQLEAGRVLRGEQMEGSTNGNEGIAMVQPRAATATLSEKEKYRVGALFPAHMMEAVDKWCRSNEGKLDELEESSDLLEGELIACLRRVDVLLGELLDSAHYMSKKAACSALQQARVCLRKGDAYYLNSLYLE